jgi:hypothetical protein
VPSARVLAQHVGDLAQNRAVGVVDTREPHDV